VKPTSLRAPLLLSGLTILAGCGKSSPPPAPPPPQVGVVIAHPQTVPLNRDLVGRLSAYYSANVYARVSGVLLKRTYQEGSTVREGQVLYEIDPSFYQSVLKNDLAILAGDQATYVYDRLTAQRDQKLLPYGSVSQETVDNANATALAAAAKVQADQAAVDGARISLSYTQVTSPIDGIAGQQQVTQGTVVGSGTSDAGTNGTLLTTVEQIDSLYANFTISAADLVTLRQSQNVSLAEQGQIKVQITLPNGSTYDQLGTLDFSGVIVNATTGAVNLRALVPNPGHELLPGLYVTLVVRLGEQSNVFLIPQQALQRDTIGAYALVVGQDSKVVRKDVTANENLGTDWIVTSGLAAGDRVIVSGLQSAHEGGVATPVPWQATPPASAPASNGPAAGSHP
jgi:membrane fusion protein, multidrug efflux system